MSDQTTEVLMFRPSDGKYAMCAGTATAVPPFDQTVPVSVATCVQQCNAAGYIQQGVRPSDAVLTAARQASCAPKTGG